jgi:uncharacterized protein
MGMRRSPIRWRSAPIRLVLIVICVAAAGLAAISLRLPVPVGWSIGLGALSGGFVAVLLPLTLDRLKERSVRQSEARLLLAEAELWCRVAKLHDPVRIGVHPALTVAGAAEINAPRMPPYVERDIDPMLDDALGQGGLIVLVGESTAGKSRTAFEAVRRSVVDYWLLAPRSAAGLRSVANAGTRLRNTVIWLDDLERYLGPDGLDMTLIERLTAGKNVVALATMRTSAYAQHSSEFQTGLSAGDELRATRNLLDCARIIRINRSWPSAAERRKAAVLAEANPSIQAALTAAETGVGFAEFLAAAPRLWDRWNFGKAIDVEPIGAAIVSAAIDCRRAGLTGTLSEGLLYDLSRAYLDEHTVGKLSPGSFEKGIAWATDPVHATSALLIRDGDGYRVFDYLVDRATASPDSAPIPAALWDACIEHLPPEEVVIGIGYSAVYERNWDIALRAFEKGTSGDARIAAFAHHGIGAVREAQGRNDAAEHHLRRALELAEAGSYAEASVASSLGYLLMQQHSIDEAKVWLERSADLGWIPGLIRLGYLQLSVSDHDSAEASFRRAAEAGSIEAMTILGGILDERGDTAGAMQAYRHSASRGSMDAATRLGKMLSVAGELAEAEKWLLLASNQGSLDAANSLGLVLFDEGRIEEGIGWLKHAADLGDPAAAYNLARIRADAGQVEEAERLLRQSARSGGLVAAINLGSLLAERGELIEAYYWLLQVVECPESKLRIHLEETGFSASDLLPLAAYNLGHVSIRMGEFAEGLKWFEHAARGGHTESARTLNTLRKFQFDHMAALRKAAEEGDPKSAVDIALWYEAIGEGEESRRRLRRLSDSGDDRARLALAESCALHGDAEEARRLVRGLVDSASSEDAVPLAVLAARLGLVSEARAIITRLDRARSSAAAYQIAVIVDRLKLSGVNGDWFRDWAAEGGHRDAIAERAMLFLRQGDLETAEPLLRQAAELGQHDAEYGLGTLFKRKGELEQAENWLRRAAAGQHVFAQINLAVLLMEQARWDEAEPFLRQAAATGDHDAECNLGVLLMSTDRPEEAHAWFDRASTAGHSLAREYVKMFGDSHAAG